MNGLLLVAMMAAVVLLVLVLWQQQQQTQQEEPERDARISPLLRGINHLLADEPDRALQELVQIAKIHTETAEVYLALGGLFRAKGEIGRAVRIHQNLLARPDLPEDLHVQAHLALGKDFQAGGFFERALTQFGKVLEKQPDHIPALEASLRIREQSSEWELAEELLLRIDQVSPASSSLHHAYLLTEMAREHKGKKEYPAAIALVERAIKQDVECASAHVLLTEIHLIQKDDQAALASMERLQQTAPQHLPLMIPLLLTYQKIYKEKGRDFLLACWRGQKDDELALAWLEAVQEKQGKQAVLKLVGLLAFEPKTLRACLRLAAVAEQSDKVLKRYAQQWRQQARNYVCMQCGVEVAEMRWQCPQCHLWGSMHPIAGDVL